MAEYNPTEEYQRARSPEGAVEDAYSGRFKSREEMAEFVEGCKSCWCGRDCSDRRTLAANLIGCLAGSACNLSFTNGLCREGKDIVCAYGPEVNSGEI